MKGGVYALEWTSEHIAVWFFPRCGLPDDLRLGIPNPQAWGQPMALFRGSPGCQVDSFFFDHNIVIDTTFCGEWAGNYQTWNSNTKCSSKAPTCQEYVAKNPKDFEDAFWEISSVKVYQ